jgi:hypothetical protein
MSNQSIEQNKIIYKNIVDSPKSFINKVLNIVILEEDEDWQLGDQIFIVVIYIILPHEKDDSLEIGFSSIKRNYVRLYSKLIINCNGGALLCADSGDGNGVVLY